MNYFTFFSKTLANFVRAVIGVVELLQTGKIIVARTLQSADVYFIIAVMYLIVITALTKFAKVLEKKVK